ncbi:YheC/YheD family protein [Paenibacillus rhizovicinus]|uniref:YheC/YheD family protein n=1 Tax=Paenibacillus rhizovicinus TaxID=2704463 RepID=A0A6C0NTN6_9BACL|nr:YheC/YheD family protein [Paenibacillus rhizovicinus]QHW29579.1 YheC/YheD family protein [Paenibacillus rhizovicinus]
MSRHVYSKWVKTEAIRKYAAIEDHVPDTRRMTKSSLFNKLKRYNMVYVKPEIGTFGNGVMRVECRSGGYKFQKGAKIHTFVSYDAMYKSILRHTGGKRYLVQKGIHLLKHQGGRFDLRVMVQYSPDRRWKTTGIIGRVAAKNKIVTNFHNGGRLVQANRLLTPHTSKPKSLLKSLSKLGVRVGRAMKSAFPGVYVIGLDVALDKTLHPWILEVNTSPDPYIFKKHEDPKVFKTIMRYARSYPKR